MRFGGKRILFSGIYTFSYMKAKIAVTYPQKVIEDMGQAIQRLADNEFLRQQMAAAALNRAAEFSWDNKAKKLSEIYIQVMVEWAHENIARP